MHGPMFGHDLFTRAATAAARVFTAVAAPTALVIGFSPGHRYPDPPRSHHALAVERMQRRVLVAVKKTKIDRCVFAEDALVLAPAFIANIADMTSLAEPVASPDCTPIAAYRSG